MNVVDSSGWLEYFADGPSADFFASALENVEKLIVPSICIFEVFKKVLQQRGEGPALQVVALMQEGFIVDLTTSLAMTAARVSLELKLPMADSIVLTTAREHRATLWTQDSDFAGMDAVKFKKGAQ